MRPRRLALAIAIVGLVTAFAWYQSLARVPDGQPAVVTLDAASLDALRAEFNRDVDRVRVIVLLAPT